MSNELPTKPEIQKYIADAMRTYGAFEVAILMSQAATQASKEYMEAGNDGAVIHKDARSLERCVEGMVGNNMLRMLAHAP